MHSMLRNKKQICYAITLMLSLILMFKFLMFVKEKEGVAISRKYNVIEGKHKNNVPKLKRFDMKNLIYKGSNQEIANIYNTAEKIQFYTETDDPSKVKKFPQCIGVGVCKSGTSALKVFLYGHPFIKVTGIPEPKFFKLNTVYNEGLDKYLEMMPFATKDEITFEKTPGYWTSEIARQRIKSFDPSMKLLLMVKNPVERSISDYIHFTKRKKNGLMKTGFKDVFLNKEGSIAGRHQVMLSSQYGKLLLSWLKHFPRQQIHIIDGDMFAKNPAVELGKVMNFMQMENIYTPDRFFYNATTGFYCFKGITGEREICAKNSKDDLYKELAEGENINVTEFSKIF